MRGIQGGAVIGVDEDSIAIHPFTTTRWNLHSREQLQASPCPGNTFAPLSLSDDELHGTAMRVMPNGDLQISFEGDDGDDFEDRVPAAYYTTLMRTTKRLSLPCMLSKQNVS
jgi:hypothetical protein